MNAEAIVEALDRYLEAREDFLQDRFHPLYAEWKAEARRALIAALTTQQDTTK